MEVMGWVGLIVLALAIGVGLGVWIAWQVWRDRFWQLEWRQACQQPDPELTPEQLKGHAADTVPAAAGGPG
jgi:hypothetical protein